MIAIPGDGVREIDIAALAKRAAAVCAIYGPLSRHLTGCGEGDVVLAWITEDVTIQ